MAARKIVLKILLFIIIITALDFVYRVTLYESDLKTHSPLAASVSQVRGDTDVIYFAESSNATYAETDSEENSISEFTSRFFPSLKFAQIDTGAIHAQVYKYLIKHLGAASNARALVVTLTLRSFGANWINSRLETPIQKTLVLIKEGPPLINRFLLSLNAYDNKSDKEREQGLLNAFLKDSFSFPYKFQYRNIHEWDSAMARGGWLNEKGEWDIPKIELATGYIKAYAFNLNENNPRIKDIDDIAEWCRQNNKQLVLNLISENVQYADSLVGKDLVFLMKQNRDFLVRRYTAKGALVADNLETVNGHDFIDQNWTSEHYNERGRKAVARKLAAELRKIFPGKYTAAY